MDDRYLKVLSQKETLVGVGIFNGPKFIVTFANPLVCQMWGKTHQQVINKPLFEALPEASHQGFEELLTSVLVTGIPYVGNELPVILQREGRQDTAYFNFVYNPLRNEEGVVTEVMVIANEVTSRVEATRRLIAERQSFYDLFMQAPAIIAVVKGPAHVFELANPLYMDLVGNRPIVGMPVREALPELDDKVFLSF